jgi:HK97 family phage major capsid protein/HK97 family phage prohead protease
LPIAIQAIWFKSSLFTKDAAVAWLSEHEFKADVYRTREEDGAVTHHIFPQFPPDDPSIVEDTWRTISDDFPEGITATTCECKSMSMKHVIGKQSDSNPLDFVMSDESVDRVGDIIEAKGWDLASFKKNPVALFGHDHHKPIGTWENVRIEGKKLIGRLKLAAEGTSAEIDTIRKLVEQRILRAVSVGFQPLDAKPIKETGGYRFIKQVLHECSLVAVPANSNALAIAKSLGCSRDDLENLFSDLKPEGQNAAPRDGKETGTTKGTASSGRMSRKQPSTSNQRKKPMNIADKITAKRERLVAIKDELTQLKGLAESDDGYEYTDEELDKIDTLSEEAEAVVKSIEALEKVEQGIATKSAPVRGTAPQSARGIAPGAHQPEEKGGSLFAKIATAKIIAHKTGSRYHDVLEQNYGHDDRVKAVADFLSVNKTAVPAATTTMTGWAAELVRTDIKGFLAELQPLSVYASLRARGLPLEFGGATSITIPRRAGNAQDDVSGSWVGEGGVIPVKRMGMTSQTLNRYKVAVISAFTNEILEQSVPAIEGIVRQAMLTDTARMLDTCLLDNVTAVTGVRPAGLRAGLTPTTSAGTTAAQIITDLKVLFAAMSARNGANPVLIMNSNRLLGLSTVTTAAGGFMFRDEAASGRLLGVPVIASTNVPAGTVLIVDAASFAAANDVPEFMVSDQTVLTMANADLNAPTQDQSTAGVIGTVADQVPPGAGIDVARDGTAFAGSAGYEAVSMYQTYSTALRMVLPTSWGMIRSGAVAELGSVAW